MSSPAVGALRLARAAAFGTVAFALALLAHTLSGGPTPRPVVLMFLAAGVSAGSVLLTGRKRGMAAVLLGLAAVQAGLHVAFMALAPVAGCSTMTMPMAHLSGSTSVTLCTAGTAAGVAPAASPLLMVLSHAAATLALAVLLVRGERALWLLFTLLLPALCRRVAPVLRHRGGPRAASWVPAVGGGRMVSGGVGRRGPPRPVARFA